MKVFVYFIIFIIIVFLSFLVSCGKNESNERTITNDNLTLTDALSKSNSTTILSPEEELSETSSNDDIENTNVEVENGLRFTRGESDKSFIIIQGVDENSFKLKKADEIEFTDILEFSQIKNRIEENKELNILSTESTHYLKLGKHFFIYSYGDVDWVGDMQGPEICLVADDSGIFTIINPDIYMQNPWYYINEKSIYIYDYSFSGGIIHVSLVSYLLATGEQENKYDAIYSLGSLELSESSAIPDKIKNTIELQNFMLNLSKIWYTV